MQTAVPEAMAEVDVDEKCFTWSDSAVAFDAIGIGPGIGQDKRTVEAFSKVMKQGHPMVIDADALNIIGAHRELLHLIPAGSILTPHVKEFERMVGNWKNDFDRLEKQRRLSFETNAVVLLKGAHSSIATPDGKVYFNSTGNPGMATGGSGDVLTGIILGLLSQRYTSAESVLLGTYLHGMAGDLAAENLVEESLIAGDIIEYLPAVYKQLKD